MESRYLLILPVAFACEFIDSSLGMGYGTTLTPFLLLLGFEPMQVVPAVLFSEFITGITAAFFHHTLKNVHFHRDSKDTRVAAILSLFTVIGTVAAVVLAVKLPANILKIWIGVIVLSMGIIIISTLNRVPRFSWIRISIVGAIASFNKGMSGGGYGPLVMGGQILSGVGVKNAVGITSLSEGITCLVGLLLYFIIGTNVDWTLAPWLMAGAVLSVPFAAYAVRRMSEKKVKFAVAVVVLILGCLTFAKAVLRL